MRPALVLLALALCPPAFAQTSATLGAVDAYGTIHAGGVVATIAGDSDRDATIALEWRVAGAPAFKPAQKLERVDATHFAGSLLDLTPGTSYDVRVTLTDPDGAGATPIATATLATRTDTLAEPTLRTLYVAKTGSDGNDGLTPGTAKLTIQAAVGLAQAGDLVSIAPGIYRESVDVPRSGTALQPIVLRGSGPGVVLDGADAAIAAGVPWTAQGNGIHALTLAGFSTGHVVCESGRMFRYDSLAGLGALGAGAPGGFFVQGSTLYVKFSDGATPAQHTIHVARLENGIVIDGRAFVRVENLEIRHYGASDFGKGVYLRYASDSAVRGSRIHENGAAGVWIKGGARHLVELNQFWDTSIYDWPWDFTKGSSAENNAVVLTDDIGRGHVIRRNDVHDLFNGFGPCGSLAPPAGFSSEVDLYENTVARITDDAFEPEGYCSNVRIFRNTIRNAHMAFAVAPAAPGPTYIVRNIAYDTGATRTSQLDGYTSSALKINSGYPDPVGPVLIYHNTFLTTAPNTNALTLLDPGASTVIRSRNNLWAGTRYVLEKINPVALDFDRDDFHTTDATRFVKWQGTSYANPAALYAGTGQEHFGIAAAPLLMAPGAGDFTPQAGSPLIDAGIALPGIDDGFSGAAPDIGAIEYEAALFRDGFE